RLSDFGLARLYKASRLSGLTLDGEFGGTLGYLAPEQLTNFRGALPQSDQYSVAATLYYLLTRRLPYDFPKRTEDCPAGLLLKYPVPIETRRRDLPPELSALVRRGLHREPGSRFADCGEMAKALMPFTE